MSSEARARRRGVRVHPLAVALMPVPAIVCVLVADGVRYGLLCLVAGVAIACLRSPRLAGGLALVAVASTAVLWFGFTLSLPADPLGVPSPVLTGLPLRPTVDQLTVGLRGALRVVSIMVLYVAAFAFVRWPVLGDTLVARFGAPYRVVDVAGLGGRFAVLIRADLAAARSLARLRARGRPGRTLLLLSGVAVPVLMRSFRHADELSVAMEARGFGALPERTVHRAEPLWARDAVALITVWVMSVALAVLLSG